MRDRVVKKFSISSVDADVEVHLRLSRDSLDDVVSGIADAADLIGRVLMRKPEVQAALLEELQKEPRP